MRVYILRRFLQMIPLLLGISVLTFLMVWLAPGDFLSTMAENPQIQPETIEAMRRKFGLDQPWYIQYLLYLKNIFLRLDFGESFSRHQPVFQVLWGALGNTLVLAVAAMCVTWLLAIPLGVLAAVRQYSWVDKTLSFFTFACLSTPEVLSGLLLVFVAAKSGWFPVDGMHSLDWEELPPLDRLLDLLHHLVLPAFVVGLIPLAGRMRQMRGNLLDVLRLEYVTTARAKGLDEKTVIMKHAVRNAINPLITLFGFTLGSLVSGAFIAEVIFSWPGLGRVTIDALIGQDQYLVMGAILMSSVVLVAGNLVADLMLAWADPRISYD